MRMLAVLVATALMMAPAAQAQRSDAARSTDKQALIRRMLEVSRTRENMLAAMEAVVPMQRTANPAIPEAFWDRFVQLLHDRSNVLIDSIIPVYDRQFSADELREVIRFYETPTGQRMVRAIPIINRETMEIGQRWGAAIGAEVGETLRSQGILKPLAQTADDPEHWHEQMSVADSAIFRTAAGTWDWSKGDSTCTTSRRHSISFSPDFREMRIRFAVAEPGRDSVYRYRIFGVGDNVVAGWERVIRAAMEGETRTTANGALAVWDLVLMSPNRFHWHRTDWDQANLTDAVVRCQGSRPVWK
jgi:uncharacterized protein